MNEIKCYEKAKNVTDCTRTTSSNNDKNSDDHRKMSNGSNKQTPTGNQRTTNS